MVGPAVLAIVYHPALLLFCISVSRLGVEEALPPAVHFPLCGDWLGVKTALVAARNSTDQAGYAGDDEALGLGWLLFDGFRPEGDDGLASGEAAGEREEAREKVTSGADAAGRRLFLTREGFYLLMFLVFLYFVLPPLIYIITMGISVCCYQKKVAAVRARTAPKLEESVLKNGPHSLRGGDFKHGLFGCFEDCVTCLHVFFFPIARIADTQQAAMDTQCCCLFSLWTVGILGGHVLDFALHFHMQQYQSCASSADSTESMCISPEMWAMAWLPSSYWEMICVAQLLVAFYSMGKRGVIREMFGGESSGKCCLDFLVWWCCFNCAAIQEARTIDAAAGVRMSCCCQLNPSAESGSDGETLSEEDSFLGAAVGVKS